MFKGILPSKRISSSDFTMVTCLGDALPNGKENQPMAPPAPPFTEKRPGMSMTKGFVQSFEKKKRASVKVVADASVEGPEMNQAFDKLLDDLQIPSTLRPKLTAMDATVKAAMLKSSQVMVLNPPSPPIKPKSPMRRSRSTDSLTLPRPASAPREYELPNPPMTAGFGSDPNSPYHATSSASQLSGGYARGSSFDVSRAFSRSQVNLTTTAAAAIGPFDVTTSKKGLPAVKNITPTKFFSILSGTSSTQLNVDSVKTLRRLLRNESASWSLEFLKLGGYSALLTRLNEILEVEWREEQHDDQILHELLRCFKALSTSSIGCFALRSSCPTPFVQLVALLYSDKKPGEIATRQLIVDLLLILFELYPPSSLPSFGSGVANGRSRPNREAWEPENRLTSPSSIVTLPAPHKTFYSLIRALLLTPAPPPAESPAAPVSPHAFIASLHRPRIYKTYLQELSDICRDYFWVFCHPNNTIWVLSETDEARVEKPRAPGGMTGGVEFEAMGYFTTHMRLINAMAQSVADLGRPRDDGMSAYRFHGDLFLSGLERIILISRKASTTYYPTLHLELARYVAHAGRAGYELPWTLSRLIGLPPASLCKNPAPPASAGSVERGTPTKRAPALPSPRKAEPIRLE